MHNCSPVPVTSVTVGVLLPWRLIQNALPTLHIHGGAAEQGKENTFCHMVTEYGGAHVNHNICRCGASRLAVLSELMDCVYATYLSNINRLYIRICCSNIRALDLSMHSGNNRVYFPYLLAHMCPHNHNSTGYLFKAWEFHLVIQSKTLFVTKTSYFLDFSRLFLNPIFGLYNPFYPDLTLIRVLFFDQWHTRWHTSRVMVNYT